MRIKIEPQTEGRFIVWVNDWSTGATYTSYDAAVRVANAISDGAVNPSGVVTIDYSECLS